MSPQPPEKGTILIVDDTPANISVLLDYLHQQGFKVLVARDGLRALEQVKHARPDLILLDMVMPGLDGFETCRRLKAEADTEAIPVIFMTTLSDTTDKMRGFEVGAVDYVIKPFQHEEVLARVTTHLTVRRLQMELQEANARLEQRIAERTAALQQALEEVEQLKKRHRARAHPGPGRDVAPRRRPGQLPENEHVHNDHAHPGGRRAPAYPPGTGTDPWRIEGQRGAALRPGMNPSTLRSRMRKLGIKKLNLPTYG